MTKSKYDRGLDFPIERFLDCMDKRPKQEKIDLLKAMLAKVYNEGHAKSAGERETHA